MPVSEGPENISLRALAGPDSARFDVPGDRPVTIGRAADCDICLLDDAVSRRHATLLRRAGMWFVVHQGSRGVTAVNGVQLTASDPTALADGDMLKIGPHTFRVVFGGEGSPSSISVPTIDDKAATMQRVERASTAGRLSSADRRLRLLTDCIERLGDATDEAALATTVLDAALAGSGYARGAILRNAPGGRDVEIVASARARAGDREEFRFSRSLIESAENGEAVVLTGGGADRVSSHSIAELGIHSALCAPVFLGRSVAAFLYLDARGQETQVLADAAAFCEAVAKAYGLTLAETKRLELERRQSELAAELLAAREVQQLIVPASDGDLGFLAYAVEVRPGLFVAGDLFDVINISPGRVAICMGDAAGHGAASAMMMAMTQSHLYAELRRDADPAAAVQAVNRYMSGRSAAGRFVSLWVGVFEADGTVRYVDAGHGHWLVGAAGQPVRKVQSATGIPVGIDAEYAYEACRLQLAPGDRVVVYSDGLIEQRDAHSEQFGVDRFIETIGTAPARASVDAAFAAVTAFAGTTSLDDDATMAVIEFRG